MASSRMRVLALEPLPGSIRRTPGPNARMNARSALGEDRGFGAREVVLGQLADPIEEDGAALVVEEFRVKVLRAGRQAGQDFREEQIACGRRRSHQRGCGAVRTHAEPFASRMPANCQRAVG